MPEPGAYLLSNVGFTRENAPYISLQRGTTLETIAPLEQTLTITLDTSQRFCIGWGDIATGERFPCPDNQPLDSKYEQCPACQRRTGFNPAFYHATSVSEQQEERNRQPHILYLAYFSPEIIKVGISLAARGNARLLEQGARSAIILDTFPSAHIARQYEAKIAKLPDIVETVPLRRKIAALATSYDEALAHEALLASKQRIEANIAAEFPTPEVLHSHHFFFPNASPKLQEAQDCTDAEMISGKVIGLLGPLLFCQQQDMTLFLPLKKYIGYRIELTNDEKPVQLPAQQMSFF